MEAIKGVQVLFVLWCRMRLYDNSYEEIFGLPLLIYSNEDKTLPMESINGDTELASI